LPVCFNGYHKQEALLLFQFNTFACIHMNWGAQVLPLMFTVMVRKVCGISNEKCVYFSDLLLTIRRRRM